jgi:alpha-tubulin suppressor-like RCC1 family protein
MVPTAVPGTLRLVEIGAGDSFSCGRTSEGDVYCWGWNAFGQLGDGTDNNRMTPGLVVGATRFVQLAVGQNFACGRTGPGDAYCWGMDQLHVMSSDALAPCDSCSLSIRDARLGHVRKPELVPGGLRLAQIGAGGLACGVTKPGAVYCWGGGGRGFDDSTGHSYHYPATVSTDVKFMDISVGAAVACRISTTRDVYCWGPNRGGGLGNGTVSEGAMPTRLGPAIPKAKQRWTMPRVRIVN